MAQSILTTVTVYVMLTQSVVHPLLLLVLCVSKQLQYLYLLTWQQVCMTHEAC